MRLFPQFYPIDNIKKNPLTDWGTLTALVFMSPVELEEYRLRFESDSFEFSSLGTNVTDAEIELLYTKMLQAAKGQGYPHRPSIGQKRQVDSDWGLILHSEMRITRNEASKTGVWNALACHYMPNLIAWRWEDPSEPSNKPSERWITQERHYRHAFGRLWWRFELLQDKDNIDDPYWIAPKLQEDELGQLMERAAFARIPKVAVILAKTHLNNIKTDSKERSEHFRRAVKLLLLRSTIRSLEILEMKGLCEDFVSECYNDARSAK